MPSVPDTRVSLILRLPCSADADAWREFVSIYEPFVYRFARRGGLQDADARELVQNVLMSVARAVGRWQPDHDRGRFRTWLFRIARNQLIDLTFKHQKHSVARGGTTMLGLLNQQPSVESWSRDNIVLSQRRELFHWAAERVKVSVTDATWQAFWQTAILQRPVDDAASSLKLSVGAVYIARSRVLARMRDEIRKWEDNDALS